MIFFSKCEIGGMQVKGIQVDDIKRLETGRCEKCGGVLKDPGLGIYVCSKCGHEIISEFGKIKKFLQESGPTNAIEISKATGISVNRIEKYLREGRIEIPEGSEVYIPCEKCGTDIRYGKYCPACAANLSKQFKSAFTQNEVGEIPKKKAGKMRFMGKDELTRNGDKNSRIKVENKINKK